VNLTVLPVTGIAEVTEGADLAALIVEAAPWIESGDILVVTSKIVSKAEGRLVEVPTEGPEREAARARALAAETARTVATRGHTRIVQTRHGFVMASAGIDASNVDRGHLVLLPEDPDASARALRADLRARYGLDVVIVVSDTMGRPWRNGLTDVALGLAGMPALRDYRGETDSFGNELQITQMAVVDELCSAAELVKGKYDQVPVAVVRGLSVVGLPDGPGISVLIRVASADLFSSGTAEARAAGRYEAAVLSNVDSFADSPVPDEVLAAALRVAGEVEILEVPVKTGLPGGTARALVPHVPAGTDPVRVAAAGAAVHRLRVALAAAGLASTWLTDRVPDADGPGAGRTALGVLAVGYANDRTPR
jgi:coenzyme F420-0:L-glutamate ligase/coenzyme F420-1:gamma-L-glutamate ligase